MEFIIGMLTGAVLAYIGLLIGERTARNIMKEIKKIDAES